MLKSLQRLVAAAVVAALVLVPEILENFEMFETAQYYSFVVYK